MTRTDPAWLTSALEAIDAANSRDPNLVVDGGVSRPKELVHAERMTTWLERLEPLPSPAQRLAARAHHFERWRIPRSSYPEGRAGYLRWRTDAKARHAADVAELLGRHGVPADVIERTSEIISKRSLRADPQTQLHEDCLCLVFFELQGLETAERLGDKAGEVVLKTLRKMSDRGRRALADAELHPAVRELVESLLRGASAPSEGGDDAR